MFQRDFCISWPCSEMAQFSTSCSKTLALAHVCQSGETCVTKALAVPISNCFYCIHFNLHDLRDLQLSTKAKPLVLEYQLLSQMFAWLVQNLHRFPQNKTIKSTLPLEALTTCSSRNSFNTVMERLALRPGLRTQDAFPRHVQLIQRPSDFESAPYFWGITRNVWSGLGL